VKLNEYGERAGQYDTEVTVVGSYAFAPEVKIPLPPEISGQIIQIVGQAAAEAIEQTAKQFREELASTTLLEITAENKA
jgi:hypothetical protein